MTRGLARMLNPLVEVMNEHKRLPRFILVIPDKDLLQAIKRSASKFNPGVVMGAAVHYLIRQFDMLVERKKIDIFYKKPGALHKADPIFI